MDILKIKLKDFIKMIIICLGIIIILSLGYYLTQGGFFDGFFLTFIGLAFIYLILILLVLFFKLITSFFSKSKAEFLVILITLGLSVTVGIYLFKQVFKLLLTFQD